MKRKKGFFMTLLCGSLSCLMLFASCSEGKSAYEIWLEAGNTGTEEDFLGWLKGEPGEKGETGAAGKSAYDIWLDAGNTGTEEDFLGWLKGEPGEKGETGAAGKSAYDIWLDAGNTGTEEDFLGWLKGEPETSGDHDGTKGLEFYSSGEGYAVSGGNTSLLSKIVVPSVYQGKPVVAIKDEAFKGYDQLQEIEIPGSITSIGKYAFAGCGSLENINLPDSVTSIGMGAFYSCLKLTGIVIPKEMTSIEASTFYECTSLKNAVIPDGVTSIGMYAINSERDFRKTQQKIPNKIENSLQMIA